MNILDSKIYVHTIMKLRILTVLKYVDLLLYQFKVSLQYK